MVAAWAARDWAVIIAPTVAVAVAALTLWINGERAERQRRRELQGRGLAAAIAYAEMPFSIRRRRYEAAHSSAERVRLTTAFSEIQAELTVCQALIDAEGDGDVAAAYQELVQATRKVGGSAAHDSWKEPAIESDPEMNMPELAARLAPLREHHARFAGAMQHASRSPWRRLREWLAEPG
jgi:hypothetical protein